MTLPHYWIPMIEPRYFVAHFNETEPYRVYGTRKFYAPQSDDPRYIWRGDDLYVARAECRLANMKRPKKSDKPKNRAKIFDSSGKIKKSRALEEAGQERLF